jgi:hypothetical protein
MNALRVFRFASIAIAALGLVDPVLTLPRPVRRPVAIVTVASASMALPSGSGTRERRTRELRERIAARLADEYEITSAPGASPGVILIGDRAPERLGPGKDSLVWAVDVGEELGPNVRIVSAETSDADVRNRIRVSARISAIGMRGRSSVIRVLDGPIALAEERQAWTSDREERIAVIDVVPTRTGSQALRLVAVADPSERTDLDNARTVVARVSTQPYRVLFVDARPSWMTSFMRRSVESDDAFRAAFLTRVSRGVAVHAAGVDDPAVLDDRAIGRFDLIVVGAPDALTRRECDALVRFTRAGGVTLIAADRRVDGPVLDLLPDVSLSERLFEQPVALRLRGSIAGPPVSELLVAARLPALAEVLADAGGDAPVIFKAPLGRGRVYFSGALDAWRQRDREDGFSRFAAALLREAARDAQEPLTVTVSPSVSDPGGPVTIVARVRGNDRLLAPISARVIAADSREPVRLWPQPESGTFAGTITAPREGEYTVHVVRGDDSADASFAVVGRGEIAPDDPVSLRLLAAAHGGSVYQAADVERLIGDVRAALPSARAPRPVRPMRSGWWMLPFAGSLCAEWWNRRTRGLR